MRERNTQPAYSNYLKIVTASLTTIATFLFAQTAGFLPTGWLSGNSENEMDHIPEKRGLSNRTQVSLIQESLTGQLDLSGIVVV